MTRWRDFSSELVGLIQRKTEAEFLLH